MKRVTPRPHLQERSLLIAGLAENFANPFGGIEVAPIAHPALGAVAPLGLEVAWPGIGEVQ